MFSEPVNKLTTYRTADYFLLRMPMTNICLGILNITFLSFHH